MSLKPLYDWYLDGGWAWFSASVAVIGGISMLIALIKGENK